MAVSGSGVLHLGRLRPVGYDRVVQRHHRCLQQSYYIDLFISTFLFQTLFLFCNCCINPFQDVQRGRREQRLQLAVRLVQLAVRLVQLVERLVQLVERRVQLVERRVQLVERRVQLVAARPVCHH